MMKNLLLADEGAATLHVTRGVPRATFVKFRPIQSTFSSIANPKAELEAALRSFAVLTEGDVINLELCGDEYELEVVEVKPKSPEKVRCCAPLRFTVSVGANGCRPMPLHQRCLLFTWSLW